MVCRLDNIALGGLKNFAIAIYPFKEYIYKNKDMAVNSTQVVICGAGPTGLSLAAQLLRYNIDFIIVEKNEHITPFSKAIVVQARSLEIFEEIGLAQEAIEAGQLTTGANIFYKGKERAHLDLSGLGEGISPFTFALSLEQCKTEKLLADHLTKNNCQIRWRTQFTRYDEDTHGVSVFYQDASGEEQEIEAQYLIGCDGASSPVRHQMGALFHGDTIPKIFYVADVIIDSDVIYTNELFMFLIEKGFVLFFPMEGEGHYRMIGIVPNKTSDEDLRFEEVKAHLAQNLQVPISIKELCWFATYKVHSRKASFFWKGHCFIAGDAAHIHTPAGGQGMNTGIQDAYNLAWKLAMTLKHKADESLLKSYDDERAANAEHLLETTDRMFDFMAGTHAFEDFIRLHVFPFLAGVISHTSILKKNIFPLISQTGIAYPKSLLTVKSNIGNVKAGDRMPYFLTDNGDNFFDKIKQPSFKLLYFGSEEKKDAEWLRQYPIQLVLLNVPDIPSHVFGKHEDFYVFLRPDNHIIYIGSQLHLCKNLMQLLFH